MHLHRVFHARVCASRVGHPEPTRVLEVRDEPGRFRRHHSLLHRSHRARGDRPGAVRAPRLASGARLSAAQGFQKFSLAPRADDDEIRATALHPRVLARHLPGDVLRGAVLRRARRVRRLHRRVDAHRGVRVRLRVQPRDAKIGSRLRGLRRGRRSGGHLPQATHARAVRGRVPPRARAIAVPVHPSLCVVGGGDDGDGGVRRHVPAIALRAAHGGALHALRHPRHRASHHRHRQQFHLHLRQVGLQPGFRRQGARADGRGGAGAIARVVAGVVDEIPRAPLAQQPRADVGHRPPIHRTPSV